MVINSRSSVDRRSLRTLPLYVLAAAALASLVHLMPVVVASLTTPEGWHFTGIHQSSPDLMQYRQWFRQTQIDGPIITNTLPSATGIDSWPSGVVGIGAPASARLRAPCGCLASRRNQRCHGTRSRSGSPNPPDTDHDRTLRQLCRTL